MDPRRKSIDTELKRAAWTYGKAGLLIDDSPECGIRAARSLYGCASLPSWWKIVRSIECARRGVDAMVSILQDPGFKKFRGIVIIDRYLPLTCAGGKAVPWSGSDAGEVEEGWAQVQLLRDSVQELRALCVKKPGEGPVNRESPGCLVCFVTSFPVLSPHRSAVTPPISWQQRTIEFLQQERRSFRDTTDWRCLLSFGPESSARIVSVDEEPPHGLLDRKADEAAWKARTWDENLDSIIQAFGRQEPAILLTGAGASLFDLPLSPGMPTTDEILERVCYGVAQKPRPDPKPLAVQGTVCTCEEPDRQETSRPLSWSPALNKTPIAWLIEGALEQDDSGAGGIRKLNWKLEELCSTEHHLPGDAKNFWSFHRMFCRELYRKDYGFPYHHWLMARLPWSAIITTNFDGFHERAAASVARVPRLDDNRRKHVLSLGTNATPGASSEGLLFKPYGSLYSPTGELALGEKQIYQFQEKFRAALEQACTARPIQERGVLVVIGHSMRDLSIAAVLKKMKRKLEKFQLLWVDPGAFARCRPARKAEGNVWEAWMDEARHRRDQENKERLARGTLYTKERSGPVPATALEFIFDLWTRRP